MAVYDRDFETTLPYLKQAAVAYSKGKWNLFDKDIGSALLNYLAANSHTVDFYFKRFLANLTLPCDDWNAKNMIWELIGYKPPYIRADYLMVQLYWPDCGSLEYIPLYMYTPFKVVADGKVYDFLVAEDYLIPPKTTKINVKLVQGELKTVELDYSKITTEIKISDDPIDYDLVSLEVSGEKWTQVRNVYYSTNTERIFSVHKHEDGIYMYLHKTWEDYLDEYDTSMYLRYVTADQTFDDYTDDCLKISFAGPLYDMAGTDVSSFYRIFPLTQTEIEDEEVPSTLLEDRAITTDDFTNKALLYPSVASCKAYSWNDSAVCQEPFLVRVIAMGPNGMLRDRTKRALQSYLQSVTTKLLKVEVLDPSLQIYNVMVILDIGDFKNTITEINIKSNVQETLEEFFVPENRTVGELVNPNDIQAQILRSDERILFADVSFMNSLFLNPFAFPVLGTTMIVSEATAIPLQDWGVATEEGVAANFVEGKDFHEAKEKSSTETRVTVKEVAVPKEIYAPDHTEPGYGDKVTAIESITIFVPETNMFGTAVIDSHNMSNYFGGAAEIKEKPKDADTDINSSSTIQVSADTDISAEGEIQVPTPPSEEQTEPPTEGE